jgi:hypothetical protein
MNFENENECLPVSILPSKVPIGDYDIRFEKLENRIVDIRHKRAGPI